jgi:hypothetical protein
VDRIRWRCQVSNLPSFLRVPGGSVVIYLIYDICVGGVESFCKFQKKDTLYTKYKRRDTIYIFIYIYIILFFIGH